MEISEDPNRLLGHLQQCLSNDKKPLGLFLGAGCPMAVRVPDGEGSVAIIPDIAGMTKAIRTSLIKDKRTATILKTVDEQFAKDGINNPTVEDVLSHLRSLRQVAGNDVVRGLSSSELDALDDAICNAIYELTDKELSSLSSPYHHVAAWAQAVRRDNPIEVFTTNYDLLMEQAFEDHRVPYFDGFAGNRSPFFDLRAMEEDTLPHRWARLWKLHGSINWYQDSSRAIRRGSAKEGGGAKRVIHPSHLKYQESRRLPYLAMLDRLRAFMRKPSAALVLCGYSFRDEHLNEVIVQGLEATPSAVAFALMFEPLAQYASASTLSESRPNLNVLARDGGVVGGQRFDWPARPADAIPRDASLGVSWKPADEGQPTGLHNAQLTLGDFREFGEFLQALTGAVRASAFKGS